MEYITARMKQKSAAASSPPDDLLEFFGIAQKNTDRLIRMVQTMLEIEYIEAGAERSLNLTQVDLTDIINESIQSFAYDAEHHNLDLSTLPLDLPRIEADEDRLRQVLTNLLGNAVKFARERTVITVCAGLKNDVIQVKVCNQGESIPLEQREKVFERFYRAGDKGGSGLGLAICRAIITAHGGTIGVTDPDEGSGVCVNFTLPVHPHNKEKISE